MTRATCGAPTPPGPVRTVCDREPGHDGPHRGYLEAQDAVVFWTASRGVIATAEPTRDADPAKPQWRLRHADDARSNGGRRDP